MAQRRHHYERAFEEFLRHRRIPYVAVDEAKKALLPDNAPLRTGRKAAAGIGGAEPGPSLKSFDFVIYGDQGANLLIDVKGRRIATSSRTGEMTGRLESWVTREDVESLTRWRELFGPGFEPAFVFIYHCQAQPPDALFQEIIEHRGQWYALRAVTLSAYQEHMKVRSPRWGTMDLPTKVFERISQPFAPPPRAHDDSGSWPVDNDRIGPDTPAFTPLDRAINDTGRRDPYRSP